MTPATTLPLWWRTELDVRRGQDDGGVPQTAGSSWQNYRYGVDVRDLSDATISEESLHFSTGCRLICQKHVMKLRISRSA